MRSTRTLEKDVMVLHMGNGNRAEDEAIGFYFLNVPSGMKLCLEQCNNSPSITRGVISVSYLRDVGFELAFMHYGISVSNDNMFYCNAFPRNGLFEIDMDGEFSGSDEILDELVVEEDNPTNVVVQAPPQNQENDVAPATPVLRISGRDSHPLMRYYGYLIDSNIRNLGDHEEPET
ncbi:hypothetical protein Tco_1375011 [Tanacetum coccineum]